MGCKGRWMPARVSLAILCATGVMELYMSRINLSIAIVAMVQTVTSETDDAPPRQPYCLRSETLNDTTEYESKFNTSTNEAPPIKMTTTERGNVLSAFFYAYWISGIGGGRLAELYGTKVVFGVAVLVDGVGNLLIPVASKTRRELLFFIRFVMGFFQGACYPSLHALMAKWIPPNEASRFMAFVYVANSFGTIFTLTICGIIISDLGWEWAFYICGSLSFVWLFFWVLLMYNTPEDHPRISPEEKRYIRESKEAVSGSAKCKPKKVPWIKMLLSRPLWAICIAHAANMFGLSFFITQLPIYMSSIIGVNIRNNGWLSSLPFLSRFMGSNIISWMFSILMKKFQLHPKLWKVIICFLGLGVPAICIVLVGYVGCSAETALTLFTVGLAFNGATASGYLCNIVEIAPNVAGTAMGITSTVGFLYAMISPVLTGSLTPEETMDEWRTVYWICFANLWIGGILYCTFMSTEPQPWNYTEVQEEHQKPYEMTTEANTKTEVENAKEEIVI